MLANTVGEDEIPAIRADLVVVGGAVVLELTARSWRSAAARVLNVPTVRRRPVRGFFFREYSRHRIT